MPNIDTTDDLIQLLQENEEFLAAARRVIYTQDLVNLPARFTEYSLKTDGRLQAIEGDMSTLKDDVKTVKDDVKTVKENTGTLQGSHLELKMHSRVRQRIGRALQLRRVRAIWTARIAAQATGRAEIFEDLTNVAIDDGLITDDEAGRLLDTDMVMTGIRVSDGELVHIAVEASSGIMTIDIDRTRDSASILHRLYGTDAIPVVYGYNIAHQQVTEAQPDPVNNLPEVHVILETDRS